MVTSTIVFTGSIWTLLCYFEDSLVYLVRAIIRLGFWKKTNLIQSGGVCASVRLSVRPRMGFVNESMYTHVYGVQWSPWRVPFDFFLNFSKIPIFGCLAAIFMPKSVYFYGILVVVYCVMLAALTSRKQTASQHTKH